MFNLENIVRQNILELKAYASARDDFSGEAKVFLDANENPYGTLNRYPDPFQKKLKEKIAELKQFNPASIFIGNGSDEILDLTIRIFCEPGLDKALEFHPSYGMYKVSAAINNIELVQLGLNDQFQIDDETISKVLQLKNLKLIIICSPNNPTGNCMDRLMVEKIVKSFQGIVLIDEAYADFSLETSWLSKVNDFPNLVVMQTLSKAWGLAAARVGIAYANEHIIQLYNKIKPPYNVSSLNQEAALEALENIGIYKKTRHNILDEKKRMIIELRKIPGIQKIYPSEANFLLIKLIDANATYKSLLSVGIVVRNRHELVDNCLRITIGTPQENNLLLKYLRHEKSTVFR